MMPMYLQLISLFLLSGLCNGQTEAALSENSDSQETSLDENSELKDCCCSGLYEIGHNVGSLTETLKSTIRRLDETTRKQEETIRRLDETTSRLEASEAQIAALNNERVHVAFTASWPVHGSQTAGSDNVPIVYKHVETNLGNAYSPVTGFFTAPVKGVYSFSFTSFFWGGSETSGGSLHHNEARVVSWYNNNVNHATSGSNSAVLVLNAGDKVNVYLWAGRTIADNGSKYTSFTGFLLYTL